MSKLRPTLVDGAKGDPCPRNGTAYMMIYQAVKASSGLIHGRLDAHGEHCAIGNYFAINKGSLPSELIDEVAAVNDSVPHMSNMQRKRYVSRWLRWKLAQLNFPGFANSQQP